MYKAFSPKVPTSLGSLPSSPLSNELKDDKGHFSPVGPTASAAESDQRLY
jgi:hypothetical protein